MPDLTGVVKMGIRAGDRRKLMIGKSHAVEIIRQADELEISTDTAMKEIHPTHFFDTATVQEFDHGDTTFTITGRIIGNGK